MKTKLTGFVALLCCCWQNTPAQTNTGSFIKDCTTTAAYSIHQPDIFSLLANPAALAQLPGSSAGIAGGRKFMLNSLAEYQLVAGMKTSTGNFATALYYAGGPAYNESQIALSYGRSLGTKADIGLTLQYNSVHVADGYGNASYLSAEAGCIFHLTSVLNTGISMSRPAGSKWGKDKSESTPSVYTVGIGYEVSRQFLITVSVQKEEKQPVRVNASLQYKPVPVLQIRAGINALTHSGWAGAGWSRGSMQFYVYSIFHPQLGITPLMALSFQFKKKGK
ncbi:MAG: hypothetical protein NTW29_14730 [Bacteroidetes bacterium]|nr:hypothetical protein [Bacteroidota bacterium]